jgi:hypothetical protein
MAEAARGSEKVWQRIFDAAPPSPEELGKAITAAQGSYKVERWWKYGQPAIDVIRAVLDARLDHAGAVVQDLVNAHGPEVQVNLDGAFPYGVPRPEGVRIHVSFERGLK